MNRAKIIRRIVERDVGNLVLAAETVQQEDADLYHAACDHFGTWETALQYAGITIRRSISRPRRRKRRNRPISVNHDADSTAVIKVIRAMCLLCYSLSASNNARRDRKLYDVARRHFGSWTQALLAAGINVENVRPSTESRKISHDDLLARLHDRHAAGKSMVRKHVCIENHALVLAVKNAFGSWRRGLLAAGLTTTDSSATSDERQ